MEHYTRSLRTVLALLIIAMVMTIGTGMPISAQAAEEQKPDHPGKSDAAPGHNKDEAEEQRNKIRKEEEHKLKKGKGIREGRGQGEESSFYPQQAKTLAERLRESAAIVAQQGGNAQPLLDAAAYFDKEAE
ncbi:hypothetical protein [Nitrosomonas communis]|uniref:Uncharacterized protein n=1 Tax=Nitrosomonas communis TaxID=44574 RepID=A0A1I4PDK6_9PROT|nr:hypothetical protein [Nitrosomonas communis]SFM25695.1 hypothetical protein SAMN05421863_101943 [Nitrosomonas communis]